MRIVFYSEPTFETWDWRNPDVKGIGGSETSHIEMAQRLAKRGHTVISLAPVPFEGPATGPGGEVWLHSDHLEAEIKANQADLFIVYRAPQIADQLPKGVPAWLICQDVDYTIRGRELTKERAEKFQRIVALCGRHAAYLKARYPDVADLIFQSSNGIKRELIEQIAEFAPERDPKRLIYASSPDRGMEFLLNIFPRVRELKETANAELHIFYGFDNIEKLRDRHGEDHWIWKNALRLKELTQQPGVFTHGRIGQPALIREWFRSAIWCHPSNFTETSCITSMDAQACGAIPITSPVWAVEENVEHGVFIEGDAANDLVQSRFVFEVAKLIVDTPRQKAIRGSMMEYARRRFDWENFVDQWEGWAYQDIRGSAEETFREALTA